jgi:succinate dehydrogenase / fumarate reductase cytochrome b subunit
MFVLLPVVWLLDEPHERKSTSASATPSPGIGFVPAFLLKLVVLALIWAYLHHLRRRVTCGWT